MSEETERLLQQELINLQEEQGIMQMKEALKKEEEYRYLKILLVKEANQLMQKVVEQLNSISLQLYDRNKVLNNNPEEEVKEEAIEESIEEVPEIDPAPEVQEEVEDEVQKETTEEVEEIKEESPKEVEELVKETKTQKKISKEITKLQKKIAKLETK